MTIRSIAIGAALLGAMGFASSADAAPKPKDKDTVTIAGCARPVVPFCTTVAYRGTTYVLHNANPAIPSRTYVRVTGKKTGTVGICPGTQLQVISWSKGRGVCTQ